MLTPSLEPDINRLSALYRYGVLDGAPDPFLDAVVRKLAESFGGMSVQVVLVDDHRLWTLAATGAPPLEERGKPGSLAAAAIEQMHPLVVGDLRADLDFAQNPSVTGEPHLRAYAAVALRTPGNHTIGVLAACDTVARSFEWGHTALLERGAARVVERLERRRIERLDTTTGALSRPAFRDQVASLSSLAARHRRDLSLLAIDIRSLRTLLQSFHADLGRLVLDRMGGLGRQNVRRVDSFGRLGESTFAVLLPNTDEAGARTLGRRILEGLTQGWTFPAVDGGASAPAGIGIATFRPGQETADDLIGRALRDCGRAWLDDQTLASQVA